jgi:hypothetical protein
MAIGWSSAHFGIFLVKKQSVSNPTLNVIGFAFAICSVLFYSQIKGMDDDEKAQRAAKKKSVKYNSINNGDLDRLLDVTSDSEMNKSTDGRKPGSMRGIAILMAAAAGLLFGSTWTPVGFLSSPFSSAASYSVVAVLI